MLSVVIYTDGACKPNPGIGGWAALLLSDGKQKILSGSDPATTNNRMEMTAVIKALMALRKPCVVDLYTDSRYLRMGITEWLPRWERNGWKLTSISHEGKPVKNADLWCEISEYSKKHKVIWHYVAAHRGDKYNTLVDQLAVSERRSLAETLGRLDSL